MKNWKGKNILVIGAARQGLAATRFLSRQGARVTLNDGKTVDHFNDIVQTFDGASVEFSFGGHPLSLLKDKDLICVSGGIPLDIPILVKARGLDITLTNDAQLFLEQTRACVIGITGSAGKTTTTTLIGEIAKQAATRSRRVWIGGNIGNPLIEHLDKITKEDWVVMELSSFQLELMKTSPHIAIVLNITPNHLDRHKSMASYINAKANILTHQTEKDIAILNHGDPGSIGLKSKVRGDLITFGEFPTSAGRPETFVSEGFLRFTDGKKEERIMSIEQIPLPGRHNRMNALAACAAGFAAGFSVENIVKGIENVRVIPHRLELIADKNGIRWINDSIATAPERVIAALQAVSGPLVLLLGGRDKDLPWEELAEIITDRHPKLILFGEAGEMIESVLRKERYCGAACTIDRFRNLEDAVTRAAQIAKPGESVLLSPGGTSYDAFLDFEERGDLFKALVEKMI